MNSKSLKELKKLLNALPPSIPDGVAAPTATPTPEPQARQYQPLPMGVGFLRVKSIRRNEAGNIVAYLWTGRITVPGIGPCFMQGIDTFGNEREFILKYSETMETIGTFNLPLFNGNSYVEFRIPAGGTKTLLVRAFFLEGQNGIKLKIPMARKAEMNSAFR